MTDTKIAIFKGKEIRKTIYKNEWWFSVVDAKQAVMNVVMERAKLKRSDSASRSAQ